MTTSYDNVAGKGYRKHLISMTSDWPWWGDWTAFIDGITNTGIFYLTGGSVTGKYCQFDFAVPCIINEITFYQSSAADQGEFQAQGSNDGSAWTDIGSPFHLGSGSVDPFVITALSGNTTPYRYFKLVGVSGSFNNGPWTHEIEFKIDYDVGNTGPSYGKPGGCLDRTSIITVTQSTNLLDVHNSGMYSLVDGLFEAGTSIYFNGGAASGAWFKFDFGSSKVINEAMFVQSGTQSHGTWIVQGSNDDSNWSDIGSSFSLGGALVQRLTSLNGNTNGYRYYRVLGVSGNTDAGPFILEVCFCIGDATTTTTRDLTVSCPATSTVSTPLVTITRSLTSSLAVASTVAAPILAITRALQATGAAGSATSAPLLAVLRALASSAAGVSGTGVPILAVERLLASSLNTFSAVTTPNLEVQRLLALLAAVISETPDITLETYGIIDLITAITAQSQGATPALNVTLHLDSSLAGQTQASDAALDVFRSLVATIALESQTSDLTLKVLRDLATAISGQSATPVLDLILSLTTAAHIATDTSSAALAVLHDLVATIAVQSTLPDIYLAMGAYRDLITTIASQTQTSIFDVTLAFRESLLTKAKRYYGRHTVSEGLKAAALSWAETEENKEQHLPGDQYNDHL